MRLTSDDQLLAIGLVVRAHGVKGKIKVKMYSGEMDALASVPSLLFQDAFLGNRFPHAERTEGYCRFVIQSVQSIKGFAIISLEGIDDMDEAQSLVGQKLFIHKEDLPKTGEDEYYYYELEGYRVEDRDGNFIGEVSRVIPSPAHDILEIKTRAGEKMVPFVDSFVPRVRREDRVIVLAPIKGMLDDEV
jgi:16S rRNA processing protein RimM